MQAIVTNPEARNARNLGDSKELVGRQLCIAAVNGKPTVLCDARYYMSRSGDGSRPVYCSLWVSGPNCYVSGYGVAKGYGYHKQSAALDDAIGSAGIKLSERIDGCGTAASEEALIAIAAALGYPDAVVID